VPSVSCSLRRPARASGRSLNAVSSSAIPASDQAERSRRSNATGTSRHDSSGSRSARACTQETAAGVPLEVRYSTCEASRAGGSRVRTGNIVAGFRVLSPIGEGAMGTVFLARWHPGSSGRTQAERRPRRARRCGRAWTCRARGRTPGGLLSHGPRFGRTGAAVLPTAAPARFVPSRGRLLRRPRAGGARAAPSLPRRTGAW
jgi:hypothetical protein